MKSKGSFQRARAIVRAAITTLRRNPGLLWFPAIAAGLHTTFATLCVAAAALRQQLSAGLPSELGAGGVFFSPGPNIHLSTAAGLLAAFGFQVISLLTAVALTHAALEALAGRPWTVREAFSRVQTRRASVAGYAVVRVTSGLLLRDNKNKGRRGGMKAHRGGPLQKVARAAWWAATYLMVPVLAREDRGPFDSIGRSATLFRSTWKEGVLGRWALGWLWFPWTVLCVAPLAVGAGLGVDDESMWLVLVLLAAGGFGLGGVVIATLDTIYRAALYVFASEGVVPTPFDVADLHTVWHAGAPDAAPSQDTGDAPADLDSDE